jgi:hypothetical protein
MMKAGYADRMTETRIHTKFWSENLKSRDTGDAGQDNINMCIKITGY